MTEQMLLSVAEVALRADLPVERLREYTDAGWFPPARRDGDQLGYEIGDVDLVRFVAGAEGLGVAGADMASLVESWQAEDCGRVQQRLTEAVAVRLSDTEARLRDLGALAARQGPGSQPWADTTARGVELTQQAARLQAAAGALAGPPDAGACTDDCACSSVLAATAATYRFPGPEQVPGEDAVLVCDVGADAGDMVGRISQWQSVFARVVRREALDGGLALLFPTDVDLAATLARLAAAEYRCCAFGSYTVVIDEHGLRLEVRMPPGAAEQVAAVFGTPD